MRIGVGTLVLCWTEVRVDGVALKGACLGVKSLALRWTGVRLGALVVVLRSLMLLGAVIRIHGLGDRKVFGRVCRGCLQIVINFAHPRHLRGVGNNNDKSVSPV